MKDWKTLFDYQRETMACKLAKDFTTIEATATYQDLFYWLDGWGFLKWENIETTSTGKIKQYDLRYGSKEVGEFRFLLNRKIDVKFFEDVTRDVKDIAIEAIQKLVANIGLDDSKISVWLQILDDSEIEVFEWQAVKSRFNKNLDNKKDIEQSHF